MLPFSKRKNTDEEMEIGDDDLVLVEDSASASSSLIAPARPSEAPLAPFRRRLLTAPGSRRIVDESVEEDVAGECLASIAALPHAPRDLDSSSHVRGAVVHVGRPIQHPTASQSAAPPCPPAAIAKRLPSVSPPPFVRTTTTRPAPGLAEASPAPAFVRRSSPGIDLSSAPATTRERAARSVAPVSLGHTPAEATVIIIRERPKPTWIIAAALIGALAAFGATRLAASPPDDVHAASGAAAVALPPLPPQTVVAPPLAPPPEVTPPAGGVVLAPGPAPSSSAGDSAGVLRFRDDQGVAFKASTPVSPTVSPPVSGPARPSPRPRATALSNRGPLLPDGSFGLGHNDNADPARNAALPGASSVATPSPATPPKRPLTPDQQLAEAQLKASMR